MDREPIAPAEDLTGRILAKLRRVGRAALEDPAYPGAVAKMLMAATVLISLVVTLTGVDRVLERLERRASYGECVDDRETAWEVAISDLILTDRATTPPELYGEMIARLQAASLSQRNVDNTVETGGCPGRQHVDDDPPTPPPLPTVTAGATTPPVPSDVEGDG